MATTTVGQLLVNEALPANLRDYSRTLNKSGLKDLLRQVAEQHPDRYREISRELLQIGMRVAQETGGNSFGLQHLQKSKAGVAARERLTAQIQQIEGNPRLSPEAKEAAVVQALKHEIGPQQEAVYREALEAKNPLAMQVLSGSRGNKSNLSSLLGSDLLYVDHHNRPIPVPVFHSYSEGLSPEEYFAGAYGARQGVVATKLCLSAGTSVLMADYSVKPIEQVQAGDKVLGSNLQGVTCAVTVLRTYQNGKRACNEYIFRKASSTRSFASVTATPQHTVLAQLKYGRTGVYSHLSRYAASPLPLSQGKVRRHGTGIDSAFVAYPSRGEKRSKGKHEPAALLMGLMLGDGCMAPSTKGAYQFSCADQSLLSDIEDYLRGLQLKLVKSSTVETSYSYELQGTSHIKRKTRRVGNRVCFTPGHLHPAKAHLRSVLGDKKAHEKCLPVDVFAWDDASIEAIVAGLFSTDGSVHVRKNGCSISITLTAKKVLDTLQRLLDLRLGIWTSGVVAETNGKKQWQRHPQWRLSIHHPEAVRRFAQRIRLVGKKRVKLEAGLQKLSSQPRSQEIGFKLIAWRHAGDLETYDIEVDHPDHLFVLASGLVVGNSTADAGYFGKQLNQVTHRLVVTDRDYDTDEQRALLRGLPAETGDPDNEGALLARETGPYGKNTVLTPGILKHLSQLGIKRLLVRSPITGGSPEGGVYANDVGVREKGVIPGIGEPVGMTAAQAISELLSQGSLGSKHAGGVAGASKALSSFDYINQLCSVPKTFQGGATHAQQDGSVGRIEPAPAGGQHVTINGVPHYVPAGLNLKVQRGDKVEAGDTISDGIPNPSQIVALKGIGEGKRYFVQALRDAMKDAGLPIHRRNAELIARGLLNHVRLTDELGSHLPGEVIPYSTLEHTWQPRQDSERLPPRRAMGRYLEQPVLHYSIGTKVKPSMLRDFDDFGVSEVVAHRDPPPFESTMVRAPDSLRHDPDWMVRLYGSGLKRSLLDAAQHGGTSDEHGTSFVPSLARSVDFGSPSAIVRTPEPGEKPPRPPDTSMSLL